jgi:hypothetical protein
MGTEELRIEAALLGRSWARPVEPLSPEEYTSRYYPLVNVYIVMKNHHV